MGMMTRLLTDRMITVNTRLLGFLVVLAFSLVMLISYMVLMKNSPVTVSVFDQSTDIISEVDADTVMKGSDRSTGLGILELEILQDLTRAKMEYPPRELPNEEDIIKLEPHVFSLLHQKFLPDMKSPCWYEEYTDNLDSDPYTKSPYCTLIPGYAKDCNVVSLEFKNYLKPIDNKLHRLRCLPYFLIIGAPKCGTSDLFHRLKQHPEIRYNFWKEPHYWTWRGHSSGGFIHDGVLMKNFPVESYLDIFDKSAIHIQKGLKERLPGITDSLKIITGEGSTSTFWNDQVWAYFYNSSSDTEPRVITADFIHIIQPDVKMILIMRDPAERVYSEYLYCTSENKSVETFHQMVIDSIQMFQSCISTKNFRWCVYEPQFNFEMPAKLSVGMYAVFIKDWLTVFPREQFLFLRTEDYAANVKGGLRKAFEFLNVSTVAKEIEEKIVGRPINNARRPEDTALGDMYQATREILRKFYQPFNEKLAELLEDNSFLWSEPEEGNDEMME